MEYVSLPSDVWNNVTTSSSTDDHLKLYLAHIRDLALKVIYLIIGTVGVVDNLFVIIIFILFIKITNKVLTILTHFAQSSKIGIVTKGLDARLTNRPFLELRLRPSRRESS